MPRRGANQTDRAPRSDQVVMIPTGWTRLARLSLHPLLRHRALGGHGRIAAPAPGLGKAAGASEAGHCAAGGAKPCVRDRARAAGVACHRVCVCVCVGGGLAVEGGWRVMGMGGQAGTGGGGMAGGVAVPVGRWGSGGRADGRSRAG